LSLYTLARILSANLKRDTVLDTDCGDRLISRAASLLLIPSIKTIRAAVDVGPLDLISLDMASNCSEVISGFTIRL
jgi:hypothetical protein